MQIHSKYKNLEEICFIIVSNQLGRIQCFGEVWEDTINQRERVEQGWKGFHAALVEDA